MPLLQEPDNQYINLKNWLPTFVERPVLIQLTVRF